ncbi:MAG: filamentous hemagglutinin N-terminal domain-containing protein [Cyanobacteria bacterium P01_E01_bin.35]
MKYLLRSCLSTFGLCLIASSANGQVTSDGSLSTVVNQQGNVAEITGGEQAGSNLFHSFGNFSVPSGNEAFFNNAGDINNILSRVTGGNISNIDGLIRANGTANLFLINPAGILFGENARLDIGGSFFGSSATGIEFEDGTEFVTNSTATPVLTINAPIGLNLRDAPGNIISRGTLQSDRNLTLSASNLELQGQLTAGENLTLEALDTITARDLVDNPFIATAGRDLTIQGGTIDLAILNHPDSGLFSTGNLSLVSDRPINGDAHFNSGGSFRLEQSDGTQGDLISLSAPVILSQSDVSLANYTGASLNIQSGGNVTIEGDLNITGVDSTNNSLQETITLSNGNLIEINGNVEPTLDIRAGTNRVNTLETAESPVQSGSNIRIDGTVNNPGGQVLLTNQDLANPDLAAGDIVVKEINTSNSLGSGGDVTLDSRHDINIPNGINTSSLVDAQLITEANLQISPQVTIAAGDAGAIALLAESNIALGDLNAFSAVNLNLNTEVDTIDEANNIFAIPQANVTAGAGGKVNLLAGNDLNLGNINSSSAITINSESSSLDNFSIVAALLELNTGNGGQIELGAGNNLTAAEINSQVAVIDRLNSNAQTTPNITLAVSQIGLTISQANIGSGGEIFLQSGSEIDAGSLDSSVSITNIANNNATIVANDPQVATVENPSRVNSQIAIIYDNTNIGQGGKITLDSDLASLDNVNSSIVVTSENSVFAEATANNDAVADSLAQSDNTLNIAGDRPGNITFNVSQGVNFNSLSNTAISNDGINSLDSVAFSNSDNAIATANGDGSNIVNFTSLGNSASTFIAFDLIVPDVDFVIDSVNNLPRDFLQPVAVDVCPTNLETVNLQPEAIETAQGKIYPARGIMVTDGQILLTANSNTGNVIRDPLTFVGCK